jgi:hypothetical protein
MGLPWPLNSIAIRQVKTVEVIKMKGVLYAVEIVVAAKISAKGTNIPVLMRSSFIGAIIS